MTCDRATVTDSLNQLLRPEAFNDYCPNGLQVEGRAEITHIVSGVTASLALIEAAAEAGADALLVHHGYFWRGEDPRLVGIRAERIKRLLGAGINLYAFHLPLDCHPTLGNNATLGPIMGVSHCAPLDPDQPELPLFSGQLSAPIDVQEFAHALGSKLGREPLVVGAGPVRRVVWCTGAGQGYIEQAADAGADLFVTGEVSEQTVHVARERGLAFVAAGHHATERYGVQAVGEWMSQHLACTHEFIDIDNPA